MSAVCESFGCLPSQAVQELAGDTHNLVLRVLDIRGFSEAWRQLREAQRSDLTQKDYPSGYWVEMVYKAVAANAKLP